MDELDVLKAGGKLSFARCLSRIETNLTAQKNINLLDHAVQNAQGHVIGITGPPGVGKSTLINLLIKEWRAREKTVGVIAIDPSSKISGGSLLGDRTRFEYDAEDEGVFVRSMSAGNRLGGISDHAIATVALMRACMDCVIVETVGIGQSETDISMISDTILLCAQPASGDTLQFLKAGVMELPNIIAVTKADLEKISIRTKSDIEGAMSVIKETSQGWNVPVLLVSAYRGKNIGKLCTEFENHYDFLEQSNLLNSQREQQQVMWIRDYIRQRFGDKGLSLLEKSSDFKISANIPFAVMKAANEVVRVDIMVTATKS